MTPSSRKGSFRCARPRNARTPAVGSPGRPSEFAWFRPSGKRRSGLPHIRSRHTTYKKKKIIRREKMKKIHASATVLQRFVPESHNKRHGLRKNDRKNKHRTAGRPFSDKRLCAVVVCRRGRGDCHNCTNRNAFYTSTAWVLLRSIAICTTSAQQVDLKKCPL